LGSIFVNSSSSLLFKPVFVELLTFEGFMLLFSYFLVEICSSEVKSLVGSFNHLKSFNSIILYVLEELGNGRIDVLFLATSLRGITQQ
jgi:hypothetical protein